MKVKIEMKMKVRVKAARFLTSIILLSLSTLILWNLVNKKILPYKLRLKNLHQRPDTRTKKFGRESLLFMRKHSLE